MIAVKWVKSFADETALSTPPRALVSSSWMAVPRRSKAARVGPSSYRIAGLDFDGRCVTLDQLHRLGEPLTIDNHRLLDDVEIGGFALGCAKRSIEDDLPLHLVQSSLSPFGKRLICSQLQILQRVNCSSIPHGSQNLGLNARLFSAVMD